MVHIKKRRNRRIIRSKSFQSNSSLIALQEPDTRPAEKNGVSYKKSFEECFSVHMSKYIGQTVSIFLKGGGFSGSGLTGILFSANTFYIQLVICKGPVPGCPLANAFCYPNSGNNVIFSIGAVAVVPLDKIASFVHNSI